MALPLFPYALPEVFLPEVFLPEVFLPEVFLPEVFLPEVFLPIVFSVMMPKLVGDIKCNLPNIWQLGG